MPHISELTQIGILCSSHKFAKIALLSQVIEKILHGDELIGNIDPINQLKYLIIPFETIAILPIIYIWIEPKCCTPFV